MNEPKQAYKTLEGQSVVAVIVGCLYFLYNIIVGDNINHVDMDSTVKIAREAVGIVSPQTTEWISGIQIPAFLIFIYKLLDRFISARTELKK